MKKLTDLKTKRIIPDGSGFLYAVEQKIGGELRTKHYRYDMRLGISASVKKTDYVKKKYVNPNLSAVYESNDYPNCEAAVFENGNAALLFSDGDIGWFNSDGKLLKTGRFLYDGAPGSSILPDGNDAFWSVIADRGVIIKYSVTNGKMVIRVGGGNNTPFKHPVHIAKYDNNLFISDDKEKKIQRVNLNDFRVSDYIMCGEPVYQYLRIGGSELALLESGVYLIR